MATRNAQTRYLPSRNSRGQLRANYNSSVNSTDANIAQGRTVRNFKGDSRTATNAQRGEAAMARATRTRAQQSYDIKRAFGVAVG